MPIDTITNQAQNLKSEDLILAEKGFYWRAQSGVKILVCCALEENGFTNGFSTRLGGVSPFPKDDLNLAGFDDDTSANIFENRKRFLQVFGSNFELATAWQVHGDDVKVVKSAADIKDGNTKFDALVSNLENVLVGVKTADCVPILLGDVKTKAFAAVHAGWRGTAFSIAAKTIEKMRRGFGTKAENLICAIGAAATGKNYEIGQDVIDAFRENLPKSEHLFKPTRPNHALIDLPRANQKQLLAAQVLPENIYVAPFCTIERTDLFFSYRQEKKLYGKTGRLLSVIGKK